MPRQVSATNEFRERGLSQLVRMQVRGLLHQAQAFDHALRADAPADSQAWKRNFRNAINLNHAAGSVERPQRRSGRPAQAQASINIIFNHRHLIARRHIQEPPPVGHGQSGASRVMKIRGRENNFTRFCIRTDSSASIFSPRRPPGASCVSTGTANVRIRAAPKVASAPGYAGFSSATASPGRKNALQSRSIACWHPPVINNCSLRTPRPSSRKKSINALFSGSYPSDEPICSTLRPSLRKMALQQLRNSSSGKYSSGGRAATKPIASFGTWGVRRLRPSSPRSSAKSVSQRTEPPLPFDRGGGVNWRAGAPQIYVPRPT